MANTKHWMIVDHTTEGEASGIGMRRLLSALDGANIAYESVPTWNGPLPEKIIFAAEESDGVLCGLVRDVLHAPQSIRLENVGGARVLSGSDSLGLAYALCEMAERVEESGEAALLGLTREVTSPSLAVRGIDKIVCNTGDMGWWMSEEYWREYLGRMLSDRYSRLVLLVGFDTPYLSPAYPFFVDVPEYPDVTVTNPDVDRKAHLAALRRLGQLVHEHGMEFVFATWQQSLWLAEQTPMVEGIGDLTSYCAAGIRELLLQCPEIDTIQLRVNHEAGVGTQITAEEYWFRQLDGIAEAVRLGARIQLDLRAKGLTDPMIAYAKGLGLDLTVSTKYWCEQAGLPHHLTRMRTEELTQLDNFNHSRRYSYSDMLRKPRLHKFLYRLWNDGSTNLFTWGDPDYVRRFAHSMKLGDARGFEIMPLLSLRGGPEDYKYTGWPLFDDPALAPEGGEEARYWLSNRLFGRIGYDGNESDEAWMRPMRMRFGKAAEPLMAAIAAGSALVPFIVGFHMPVHPQLNYWAEFSTGGALFTEHNHNEHIKKAGVTYQNTEPGDAGLFYPVDRYAADFLAGREDGRYTPWQVIAWLSHISDAILRHKKEAESAGLPDSAEAKGVLLDLAMQSELALYHRAKMAAAVAFSLYETGGKREYLANAASCMEDALAKWKRFAKLGEAYHKRLVFFVGNKSTARVGHWNDFLPELEQDLAKLRSLLGGEAGSGPLIRLAEVFAPAWLDDVPASCEAGKALAVTLSTGPRELFRGAVNLRYRHTNQMEGGFLSLPMRFEEGVWRGEIPAEYVSPEWDLLVYFDAVRQNGDGAVFPGIWHPAHPLPYHIVEVTGGAPSR